MVNKTYRKHVTQDIPTNPGWWASPYRHSNTSLFTLGPRWRICPSDIDGLSALRYTSCSSGVGHGIMDKVVFPQPGLPLQSRIEIGCSRPGEPVPPDPGTGSPNHVPSSPNINSFQKMPWQSQLSPQVFSQKCLAQTPNGATNALALSVVSH